MKKKKIQLLSLLMILVLGITGCQPIVEETPEHITLYATFYPIYALSNMITQDIPDLELHCLVQPQDGCIRDYSLSDWDLYMLAYSANAVIAGGCGLESFEDTLTAISESGFALAEVLYGLELYEWDEDADEDSHYNGKNPHLYLSVQGAADILENISGSLCVMDARYAEQYQSNLESALQDMNDLQSELCTLLSPYKERNIAIMNEALVYVAEDYHLNIVTIVPRESGEHLYGSSLDEYVEKMRSNGAEIVLVEKQAPKILVDDLEAQGFEVAQIDIMSTLQEEDGTQGYFTAQRANAQAIKDAFDRAAEKN